MPKVKGREYRSMNPLVVQQRAQGEEESYRATGYATTFDVPYLLYEWDGIKYWVAMHWKTHRWESRVNSQRNDRQSAYDREKAPQDAPVDFIGEANIQHTIDTWRKRLCRQASAETREYAEDFKKALHEVEPEWSDVLVPNCIYRCGCPEPMSCGWYEKMIEKNHKLGSTNIQERYDAYNEVFYGD